jgi:dolichol-phosphate mannosyltransferase
MPCDLSIILPTYNERDHIVELLHSICRIVEPLTPSFEIVVVDDDSPDGTAEEAARVDECRVRVVRRRGERGLAGAVRCGIEHSAGHTLLIMDADFNHRPEDIPRLFTRLASADVVVGSRYVRGGGMHGPRWRKWSSWLMNLLVRRGTGSRVRDNTSGFLCFERSVLRNLDCDMIFLGYGDYCIRLLHEFQVHGRRIAEVPVVYGTRKSGISKTSFLRHSGQYVRTVQQIRGHSR